jgi:tetratricopeptide (TPR) repeat protein
MNTLARLPVKDRRPRSRAPRLRRKGKGRGRYFAFLSYSHRDEELADWLHRELEDFRTPPALAGKLSEHGVITTRLTPIFRDEHELAAADDLGEEIEAALAASQYLIVLCSPNAAQSHWTNAEIELFKRTRPDGCVLAAIASGEPFATDIPGREHVDCFPPALRQRYDSRGRPTGRRAEPLAADLREQGDGRRLGLLKLIAGMLGVGLDDLVQRETARRHRRLAWLAAASLAGMAVTSTLAFTAIQARDSARDQRREAEGLVAFMLGDLKDKLEPIGRLDALDGVGSRVLEYYSKQDASELSDAALVQRSRALSLSAQVAYLRGNLDVARRLYGEALAGTEEAVRRNPQDPQRLYDHAQNVFWVGDLARRRGDISQAEAAFREYGRLADRMVAIAPDNLKWRMEVQYARENLGIVLMTQRRFAEAGRQFASALGPMQSLANFDPTNGEYRREVSNVLGWLADARRAEGRADEAIALRQRQVLLLEQPAQGQAADVVLNQQFIPAHEALGVLYSSKGAHPQAIAQHRLALAQAQRLMAVEPENSLWKDMEGSVRLELAKSLLALGKIGEANAEAAAGCDAANALRARDANVASWRSLQTICLEMRARLAAAANAKPDALKIAEAALRSAHSERSGDPIKDRYRIAEASRLVGDARASLGDRAGAIAAWSAGLGQIPSKVAERPWETSERVGLLNRLGRRAEASPLADRLAAIGYKSFN